MEHHSNIVPWHFQRERKGAVLKWVDVAADGTLRPATPSSGAIAARPSMVAHHAYVERARHGDADRGDRSRSPTRAACAVLVDGSQGAVHTTVDVQATRRRLLRVTGHKLYGPTGIGVLYGKL